MARIRLPDSTDTLRTSYKFQIPHVPGVLQPRFTWRYCLASAALAYVAYCLLFGKPFFSSNLPRYTGNYDVGAIDIEVPVKEPRLIDDALFKSSGEPAFKLDTVLFTLYYPSTKGVRSGKHHYWIPEPLWLTAVGYAKFAHISNVLTNNLFTGVMGILVGGRKIPAQVDVPLINTDEIQHVLSHKTLSASSATASTVDVIKSTDGRLPIIIFTHGMASSRTQYSHYLGELASRGYVVAAIEHRDGSCPGTRIIDSSTSQPKTVDRLHFDLADVKLGPKSDISKIEVDDFKRMQLAYREAEIFEVTNLVHSLSEDSSAASQILSSNSRKEGTRALLPSWHNRLDINTTILIGHSYGATGALQGLKPRVGSLTPLFAGGIALDPGKSSGRLNTDISVPTLLVHSTSWSAKRSIFYGRPHFDVVKEIATNLNAKGISAWFMTSLGTSHPSVTDAPLLEPLLLKWTTGAGIDAHEGLRQYVHVSDDFGKFVRDGVKRNLLALPANSEDYTGKKGNEGMAKEWRDYWQIHASPIRQNEE